MFNTTLDTVVAPKQQTLNIEFLFLDLKSCTRCIGTQQNLEKALQIVADALTATQTAVTLEKIHITSEAEAQAHQFVTSPTIRVNGRDIALETVESNCSDCSDLCGCAEGTQCREWLYQGELYHEAPVGLIVEAVLQAVFATPATAEPAPTYTAVPDNLKTFFAGKQAQEAAQNSCCTTAVQQSCCEPADKADCCGTTAATGSCGCQD